MSTLYMFPPNEKPTENSDVLAGEYVLGVLDAGDAAAARLRADSDPALLGAIGAWQARLVPMTAMLPDAAPPPELWERLAVDIGMPVESPLDPETEAETPIAVELALSDALEAMEVNADEPEPFDLPADVAEIKLADAPAVDEPEPLPAPQDLAADLPEAAQASLPEVIEVSPSPPEPSVPPPPVMAPPPVPPEPPPQSLTVPPSPPIAPPALIVPTATPIAAANPTFARLSLPREPELRPVAPLTIPAAAQPGLLGRLLVWRIATGVCLALAVGFAALAFTRTPAATLSVAAIGVANAPAPIYLAQLDAGLTLRITPLAVIAVPGGRDLQLWMLAQDSQEPIALGVLPPEGITIKLQSRPKEGTRFIVSMEPSGSQTGRITGQILYGGTLATR